MATLICKDLIDECQTILIGNQMFAEAEEQRHRFIAHLKKENEIDHQMRRAYLEIVVLNILADDKFKIKKTLDAFRENTPNCHKYDEYKISRNLKEAMLGDDTQTFNEIDWH